MTFFSDRVVLVPMLQFVPKVVTQFHLNQQIEIPFLGSSEDLLLTRLDVGSTLKAYISATEGIRSTDSLFVIPAGARKGSKPSSLMIAAWMVRTISLAYKFKDIPVPVGIVAHSTRSLAASWAAAGQVSLETICKAASWSSEHTFMSFYRIDPASLTFVAFGRAVISAAVSQ